MAPKTGLWLIGVRKDELNALAGPRFLTDLQMRYRARENKREGTASVVRNVPVPYEVTALQRQYGREYAAFYYVDEALVKAAEKAGIKLNRLQFVFGDPPGGKVFALVSLPPEYGNV